MSKGRKPGPIAAGGSPDTAADASDASLYFQRPDSFMYVQPGPIGVGDPVDTSDVVVSGEALTDLYRQMRKAEPAPSGVAKMLSRLKATRTWAGFAVKTQGHLVVAGWTAFAGKLWNLDDPSNRTCNFTTRVRNLGPGLGGNTSLHLVFFLNVKNLAQMEGMDFGNGGNLHFDIPAGNLGKLAKGLKGLHTLYETASEFVELVSAAAELYKDLADDKPHIVEREVGELALMVGYTYGFQGRVDILRVTGRGGEVDDL